ncbi:hypothetical protein MMC29_007020 [Sticta canariensis]|nr:hypothetical protein [Sticta canariensis]
MEDFSGRLQLLERIELDLFDERKRIASQRTKEDYDIKEKRAREDENLVNRFRRRDHEEAELRLRRCELEITSVHSSSPSGSTTSSVSSQSKSSSISSKLSTRSYLTESNLSVPLDSNHVSVPLEVKRLPSTHSSQPDGSTLILVTPPTTHEHQRKRKRLVKNEVRQKRVEGSRSEDLKYRLPIAFDSTQEPLYVRPSDGKLVSLKCCIEGCKATGFSSVDSLIRLVRKSCIMSHNGGRRLLSTIRETIEICSHVVPGQEDEEPIKHDVDPDKDKSVKDPPGNCDEIQHRSSLAPHQGALRSNREKHDIKKKLGSKEKVYGSGIQDTELANVTKTIPLTERDLQELCAREQEQITMGRTSEG